MSRSGYYYWKKNNSNSPDSSLNDHIKTEFKLGRSTYGSPRIYKELKKKGIKCSLNTVAKRMKIMGLKVKKKKKFKVQTTDSKHNEPIAPRIFRIEDKLPSSPNKIWAGDITYLPVRDKFYYLSIVLDLFNREVVGYSLDKTLEASGVCQAIKNAIVTQDFDPQLVFHSDRGSQYASEKFRNILNGNEVIPSMSRKANCYDNCYVESFFKTLKSDLIRMEINLTHENIQSEIFKYIECWYNSKRSHSSLNYESPKTYKKKYLESA